MSINSSVNLGFQTTSKQDKEALLAKERAKNIADWQLKNQMAQAATQAIPASVPINTQMPAVTLTNAQGAVVLRNVSPSGLTIEQLQEELFKRKEELNKKAADMKLDADMYRLNVPSIRLITEDKTPAERLTFIGNMAIITGVPIIVVACYMGEIYGFSDELKAKIAKLMEFYTIKEILNVKRPNKDIL